jgi:hypothetical protein
LLGDIFSVRMAGVEIVVVFGKPKHFQCQYVFAAFHNAISTGVAVKLLAYHPNNFPAVRMARAAEIFLGHLGHHIEQ